MMMLQNTEKDKRLSFVDEDISNLSIGKTYWTYIRGPEAKFVYCQSLLKGFIWLVNLNNFTIELQNRHIFLKLLRLLQRGWMEKLTYLSLR